MSLSVLDGCSAVAFSSMKPSPLWKSAQGRTPPQICARNPTCTRTRALFVSGRLRAKDARRQCFVHSPWSRCPPKHAANGSYPNGLADGGPEAQRATAPLDTLNPPSIDEKLADLVVDRALRRPGAVQRSDGADRAFHLVPIGHRPTLPTGPRRLHDLSGISPGDAP